MALARISNTHLSLSLRKKMGFPFSLNNVTVICHRLSTKKKKCSREFMQVYDTVNRKKSILCNPLIPMCHRLSMFSMHLSVAAELLRGPLFPTPLFNQT